MSKLGIAGMVGRAGLKAGEMALRGTSWAATHPMQAAGIGFTGVGLHAAGKSGLQKGVQAAGQTRQLRRVKVPYGQEGGMF